MSDAPRLDRPRSPLPTGQNTVALTGINGVPLGGIGAGCVEIVPDGRLANFSTNNNFRRNERIETMPGSFLAFAASDGTHGGMRLLQSESSLPLGPTGRMLLMDRSRIHYDGLYPRANVRYDFDRAPIELSLVASGTVVPGDLYFSCMPVALFTFDVKNVGDRPAWASILFSWENIAGCLHGIFPDGRKRISKIERKDGRLEGLRFESPEGSRPNQTGSHVLLVDAPDGAHVTAARFNSWDASIVLQGFEDIGHFGDGPLDRPFFAEAEFTGALACKIELAAGESREVTFALAWHFPDFKIAVSEFADKKVGVCDMGHQYANHFKDAEAVARVALARRGEISSGVTRFHNAVMKSSLPPWLGRMLINNLYVLTPGTLWDRFGRFSLMETPYGPMMGTLDQRFYSSVATALFFPELEKSELSLFGHTNHPEDRGRVYHDLGNLRFDDPKTGTTAKKWTDLNPKFVMMALRNFQWTNDRAEIESLWPSIKEMMAYTLSQDTDGDDLPNNDDRSTTYDDWAFFGANSYASSIWLGALASFRRMAMVLGREADWKPYEAMQQRATRSFEDRLWDEQLGYYRLYNDDRNPVFENVSTSASAKSKSMADSAVNQGHVPAGPMADHPKISRDCHDGQLAGQWFADMLGLGKLVDPERIRRAARSIYQHNATPRGMRKGVTPQGEESANPKSSGWWSEAGQCWPGYEVAHYAAMAIHNGEVTDALTTVERLYQHIHVNSGLAWNQPLRWSVDTGHTYGWGCDRYMNSPAVWCVYLALSGVVINRPQRELAVRPRLTPGQTTLDLPIFTPGNWGRLHVEDSAKERILHISFERDEAVKTLRIDARDFASATIDAKEKQTMRLQDYGGAREFSIEFESEIQIGPRGSTIRLK